MGRFVTFRAGIEGAEKDITVEVHDLDADPWPLGQALRVVGTEVPRLDGPAKATGAAKYTQDVSRPNLAYVGFVLSPHAHADVTSVDTTATRILKGVLGVKAFARTRVTHAGQAVAAVCAENPRALEDALRAIRVSYKVQPHAVTVEDALPDSAPRVDPSQPNLARDERRGTIARGDAKKAVAEAEASVSAEFRTQVQTHSALEPHGTVVEVGADGGATVWASTQATGSFGALARPLGVAPGALRVITEHMGGGFGAKFGPTPADLVAAEFAKELGRPVQCMLTRRQEHLIGGNRPDSIQRMTLAGTRDGKITALVGETLGTAGNGRGGAGAANTAVYEIPAVHMTQATVSTFTERGVPFRAPGHPQGLFALEGAIDLFAQQIGMDPLEVRLKNDPHPVRQAQWRVGAERIGWAKERRKTPGSDPGPVKRGLGCAAGLWYAAGRGDWKVDLTVARDGTVTVMNAVQDIGTGTRTLLAILVAEELGVAPSRVQVRIGDTRFPPGPGSGGSTTAPSMGPAAREAGLRAREQLEGLLAAEWGVDPKEVKGKDGTFAGPGGTKATFQQACALIGDAGLSVQGVRRENYAGYHGQTAGCQFAQVAVDVETGVVAVERVVAVHDCGRVVDALTARSQVNGGVIQGVSYALFEERRLDRAQGDMVNPTLDTYRIAGMKDCPEIDVILTSLVSGFNNVGMMGLGEPATVPTAAAIGSAVFNAIGVQVRELPMTPARVLAALERRAS